jgi:peroxiredoxin
MVRMPSIMVPLGTQLPAFSLPDGSGVEHASKACSGEAGTLVIFMCNHCPFVVHVAEELAALGRDYAGSGIGMVAINSNDVDTHPDDSPEQMLQFSARHGLTFPYLHDESQDVARAFDAACTPDFFLHDSNGKLVYRGQLDAARPGSDVPVTGRDLRLAMDALLSGRPVADVQVPSVGCNIKWKPTD